MIVLVVAVQVEEFIFERSELIVYTFDVVEETCATGHDPSNKKVPQKDHQIAVEDVLGVLANHSVVGGNGYSARVCHFLHL